jgi:hypothetical protein
VRVLVYTGAKFNFYDVIVMALDEQVLPEQVEKPDARRPVPEISTRRRLNFEMSVNTLYQSMQSPSRLAVRFAGRKRPALTVVY